VSERAAWRIVLKTTEASVREGRIRNCEVWMIEEIEEFGAELQPH
jgi:hypothetical protein